MEYKGMKSSELYSMLRKKSYEISTYLTGRYLTFKVFPYPSRNTSLLGKISGYKNSHTEMMEHFPEIDLPMSPQTLPSECFSGIETCRIYSTILACSSQHRYPFQFDLIPKTL